MRRSCALFLAGLIAAAADAHATPTQTFTYKVEHPSYGDIGTFTDTVAQEGDLKRIDSKLRIAVRILGIVVHREEADRTEIWRGNRLTEFHSITRVNGTPIEVHGEAQGNGFVITSPAGVTVAPPDIYPSSPWVARLAPSRAAVMMSTKTGKVMPVETQGGESEVVNLNGVNVSAAHFAFFSDKRQDVWLDRDGVPVLFRTEQSGNSIDFVLTGR